MKNRLLLSVFKTTHRFSPSAGSWRKLLADPRRRMMIQFEARFLVCTAICLYLFRLGARRRLRFELRSPQALRNVNRLAGTRQQKMPHDDTVAYLFKRTPAEGLRRLRTHIVRRMLRGRTLEAFYRLVHRLRGCFPRQTQMEDWERRIQPAEDRRIRTGAPLLRRMERRPELLPGHADGRSGEPGHRTQQTSAPASGRPVRQRRLFRRSAAGSLAELYDPAPAAGGDPETPIPGPTRPHVALSNAQWGLQPETILIVPNGQSPAQPGAAAVCLIVAPRCTNQKTMSHQLHPRARIRQSCSGGRAVGGGEGIGYTGRRRGAGAAERGGFENRKSLFLHPLP